MKTELRFGIILSLAILPHVSHANDPVPSPVPSLVQESEAAIESRQLFEAGVESFGARKFSQASKSFETLLEKHPSTAYRLEGLHYLGQSRFHEGKFAESIKPFQSTIEAAGNNPIANEARVLLGNAYLETEKFTEAFLVSEELLRQNGLRSTLRGKALLIRAQSQAGMKQPLESEKSFTIFQAVADQDPELERELARSFLFSLILKGEECDRLASTPLAEDALLFQMNQKGICLLEMGALLSRSARTLSSEEIKQGSELVLQGYQKYAGACAEPPLLKGKRSKKQLQVAKSEIAEQLKDSCRSTFDLLVEGLRDREAASDLKNQLKSPKANST